MSGMIAWVKRHWVISALVVVGLLFYFVSGFRSMLYGLPGIGPLASKAANPMYQAGASTTIDS